MSSAQDMTPGELRQQQTSQIEHLNALVHSLLHLMGPTRPAIIPGALYTRTQVETNLNMGDGTMTLWLDNGLKRYRPATRSDLMLGDDIIEFVTNNAELKRPANYKAKIEQRKKGRGK